MKAQEQERNVTEVTELGQLQPLPSYWKTRGSQEYSHCKQSFSEVKGEQDFS